MAETLTAQGEAINKVLEGIDDGVKDLVLTGIEFFGKEKSESGNKIEDVVKVNKMRTGFNSLVTALVTNKLNELNQHQRCFLCTGAIADEVEINGSKIKLLEPELYQWLMENFDKRDKANPLSKDIYNVLDKMKALAEEALELIDTSGKKKRKNVDVRDPKKVKAELEWKKNDALRAGANMIRTFGQSFDKIMQIDPKKLAVLKQNYTAMNTYFTILQKGARITEQEKKLKIGLGAKTDAISKVLGDFTKLYAETFARANENIEGLKEKVDDIKEIEEDLKKVGNVQAEQESKAFTSFKEGHIETVKRDISIINSFIVSAAEKSSNRVPFSGARILVNSQIPDIATATSHYFCTPANIIASLEKILSFHVDAFPKDEDGNYVIPPIIIEPIRNYVDFLEDRFIMGFVSGEVGKKGANISFTPVDFQVMKAVGMYLAKDSVYDYRGDINVGTFMGDYTGKVEKTAQVKWTGSDKKMNMVMSSELVDAASRDDAVEDYMNFYFNALNGLGPPPKMSKRKIGVLLRYTTLKSIENNVKLLLQYVAQSEPTEVRDTVVKYYNRNYDKAKEVVRQIVKEDPIIQRTLGSNPEVVISKIFV